MLYNMPDGCNGSIHARAKWMAPASGWNVRANGSSPPSSSWVGCDIHTSRHGQQPMDGSRRQVGASHWLVPHHIGAGSGFRDAPVASVGRTTIVYSSGSNNPPADPWSGEPRSSVSPRHRAPGREQGESVWLQEAGGRSTDKTLSKPLSTSLAATQAPPGTTPPGHPRACASSLPEVRRECSTSKAVARASCLDRTGPCRRSDPTSIPTSCIHIPLSP